MLTDKENVLVHESTMRLLGHVKSLERVSVQELQGGFDWLVFWLGFERDVFHGHQVDLERIQFLAVKI